MVRGHVNKWNVKNGQGDEDEEGGGHQEGNESQGEGQRELGGERRLEEGDGNVKGLGQKGLGKRGIK